MMLSSLGEISMFSLVDGIVTGGDEGSCSHLVCLNLFDEDEEVDVEECDEGDVAIFGLFLGGSSVVFFGDIGSTLGGFVAGSFDALLAAATLARSRSMNSCC